VIQLLSELGFIPADLNFSSSTPTTSISTMAETAKEQAQFFLQELMTLDLQGLDIFATPDDGINMLRVAFGDKLSALTDGDIAAILRGVIVPCNATDGARLYFSKTAKKVAEKEGILFDILGAVQLDTVDKMEQLVIDFTASHDASASQADRASTLAAMLLNWHSLHLRILAVSHYLCSVPNGQDILSTLPIVPSLPVSTIQTVWATTLTEVSNMPARWQKKVFKAVLQHIVLDNPNAHYPMIICNPFRMPATVPTASATTPTATATPASQFHEALVMAAAAIQPNVWDRFISIYIQIDAAPVRMVKGPLSRTVPIVPGPLSQSGRIVPGPLSQTLGHPTLLALSALNTIPADVSTALKLALTSSRTIAQDAALTDVLRDMTPANLERLRELIKHELLPEIFTAAPYLVAPTKVMMMSFTSH
jgi:hypothetical protein